jgi:regulator of protease activity HflC (stomatin/prohibitin superfamily)
MKKIGIIILAFMVLASGAFFAFHSAAQTADREAVKIPLNNYLQGHITGDPDFIRKAFWPEGRVTFVREGKLTQRSAEEFAAGFPGKPAADEAQRKRSIESIDITGNAATAKIVLDYPAVKFTDYMTLLKIDGEWRIINKSFYAEPKAAPAAKPAE